MDTYQNMVYRIALTHTGNRSDADDAFQQTFLVYFSKSRTFHEEEHRKAWLIRTAINCSRKITASSWKKKTAPFVDGPDHTFHFALEEEDMVYTAINSLPIKYRTVIHLHYFEELSAEEIAGALKMKSGTVRMQLLRGRDLLREKLKGDYFDEV